MLVAFLKISDAEFLASVRARAIMAAVLATRFFRGPADPSTWRRTASQVLPEMRDGYHGQENLRVPNLVEFRLTRCSSTLLKMSFEGTTCFTL